MDKQNREIFHSVRNSYVGTHCYPHEFNMHRHVLAVVEQHSQNKGARLPDPYQNSLIKYTNMLLEVSGALFILGPPASFHDHVQSQTQAQKPRGKSRKEK